MSHACANNKITAPQSAELAKDARPQKHHHPPKERQRAPQEAHKSNTQIEG